MRLLLGLFLSLFLTITALAQQDSVFYAIRGNRVATKAKSKTYVVLSHAQGDTTRGVARTYLTFGDRLIHENPFTGYWNPLHNGIERAWDTTGHLALERNAVNGKLDGEFKTYYPNGHLRRFEVWENGTRKSGICYDVDGKEVPYYDYYESPHTRKRIHLDKFIFERVDYSKRMYKRGIRGTILVSFIVNRLGAVTYVNIDRGIDPDLDQQVAKAIWDLPNGTPGKVEGQPFPVRIIMPITFGTQTVKRKWPISSYIIPILFPITAPFIMAGNVRTITSQMKGGATYQLPGNPIFFEEPIAGPLPLD